MREGKPDDAEEDRGAAEDASAEVRAEAALGHVYPMPV
jgi:hypothetical protein